MGGFYGVDLKLSALFLSYEAPFGLRDAENLIN